MQVGPVRVLISGERRDFHKHPRDGDVAEWALFVGLADWEASSRDLAEGQYWCQLKLRGDNGEQVRAARPGHTQGL